MPLGRTRSCSAPPLKSSIRPAQKNPHSNTTRQDACNPSTHGTRLIVQEKRVPVVQEKRVIQKKRVPTSLNSASSQSTRNSTSTARLPAFNGQNTQDARSSKAQQDRQAIQLTPPTSQPDPALGFSDQDRSDTHQEEEDTTTEDDATSKRKRTVEELKSLLAIQPARKRRRKDCSATLGSYLKIGKWFPRACDAWLSIDSVLRLGIDSMTQEHRHMDDGMTDEDRERHLVAFKKIQDYVPGFDEFLRELMSNDDNEEVFDEFLAAINELVTNVRQNDTNRAKDNIHKLIPLGPLDILDPPLSTGRLKSDRGVNHPHIAEFLCPHEIYEQCHVEHAERARESQDRDEEDSEIALIDRLRSGEVVLTAEQFPMLLYDLDVFDSDDIEKGLMQNYILPRVYRTIFTSPSSGRQPKLAPTRASNAKILGITSVSKETIAYATMHAYFALSDTQEWGEWCGTFNLKDFYYAIMDLFDDPEDDWTKETLEWWNENIFEFKKTLPTTSNEDTVVLNPNSVNDLAKIRAERRRQRELKKLGDGTTDDGVPDAGEMYVDVPEYDIPTRTPSPAVPETPAHGSPEY